VGWTFSGREQKFLTNIYLKTRREKSTIEKQELME
jgi:hypothetical protein